MPNNIKPNPGALDMCFFIPLKLDVYLNLRQTLTERLTSIITKIFDNVYRINCSDLSTTSVLK